MASKAFWYAVLSTPDDAEADRMLDELEALERRQEAERLEKERERMKSLLLGPQPTRRECCPSCQIIARAVARLAYAIGYEETGDELTDLLAAMGGER